MEELINAACDRLRAAPEQIVGSAVVKDELVVLVDYGIGGIKKYRIPLADLRAAPPQPAAPDESPAPEPEKPKASKRQKK